MCMFVQVSRHSTFAAISLCFNLVTCMYACVRVCVCSVCTCVYHLPDSLMQYGNGDRYEVRAISHQQLLYVSAMHLH
jgi:hypothetical protein